ncbi:DUF4270 domain-containing protein [Formosa sp. S-31]|uniref:DUF4270 domain-containing protein n=1 Tax=Formosa sp. S-31 TaxID=2790949 RepID=UPI003EB8CBD5
MKKTLKALKNTGFLILVLSLIIACDKDYNTIGTDIIGGKDFITDSISYPVTAYTKKVKPVQTNGLTSNLLGVFNDPEYGLTTANVVTQIVPQNYNPSFGTDATVDSVTLVLPYYSTLLETDDDDNSTYKIDSLFGGDPIKLSIYENKYYLRTTDPNSNFDESQVYYSNANESINFNNFTGELLYSTEDFVPSEDEIIIKEINEDTEELEVSERLSPRLKITFTNNNFWQQMLINKEGSPELSNQNNFVNSFRGLYFKTEAINGTGNQVMLNFSDSEALITMYYSYKNDDYDAEDEDSEEILTGEFTLSFNSTRLNTLESDIVYNDGNSSTGDDNLYLKGGEGSMGIIDLFSGADDDGDGLSDVLNEFQRNKDKWLINEAQLTIYEDPDKTYQTDDYHLYDRLFVYDVKNSTALVDYSADPTSSTSSAYISSIYHLGQRIESKAGTYKYKIRLTEHIKNILKKDSTNTKLGIVLSTNVNSVSQARLLDSDADEVTTLPSGAVLEPKGTVLYGSTTNVPEGLRVKLDIYYTDTDQEN